MANVLFTILSTFILMFVLIACGGAIFLGYEKSKHKWENRNE